MTLLSIGLKGTRSAIVSHEYTANAMGSGSLDVYATPALVALMEAAAVDCLNGYLDASQTSVGGHIDIKHIAATPVGQRVRAEATIIEIDLPRVKFSLQAFDEHEPIGKGTHVRFIVDVDQFLARLNNKYT